MREYLARRGLSRFKPDELRPARCPLLGYHKESLRIEGQTIGTWFMDVSNQPEVGEEAYDAGAKILTEFFHDQLQKYLVNELEGVGREIIQACLDNATLEQYEAFSP